MIPSIQERSAASDQEYLAFISYRHADNTEEDRQWATWLHQQLRADSFHIEIAVKSEANAHQKNRYQ
jgi:hypothetical protein